MEKYPNAEVYWATGAKHRGGYAYRLCKIPEGGISKITEQCFQLLQLHSCTNLPTLGSYFVGTACLYSFIAADTSCFPLPDPNKVS